MGSGHREIMRKKDSLFVLLLALLFLLTPEVAGAEKRITIGTVEEVILLPWNIKLPARIDTGAAKTSLDARNLKIDGNMAEFRLPEESGEVLFRPDHPWSQ